ncbi:MAG: hypothetical protein KKG13_04480 [Nanoarchaeota archaeon]|nr:hypothetical protein [Nanoarchaeota archaeon]
MTRIYHVKELPSFKLEYEKIELDIHSITNPEQLKIAANNSEKALEKIFSKNHKRMMKKVYGGLYPSALEKAIKTLYDLEVDIIEDKKQRFRLKVPEIDICVEGISFYHEKVPGTTYRYGESLKQAADYLAFKTFGNELKATYGDGTKEYRWAFKTVNQKIVNASKRYLDNSKLEKEMPKQAHLELVFSDD